MIGSLEAIVPHIKATHVSALAIWCAGVIALPLMLAHHDPAIGQADYARIRRYTHYAYAFGVTPAAVVTVTTGTMLVFLRDVFTPWMFTKFVLVAVLVATHGFVGHQILRVSETAGRFRPAHPATPAMVTLVTVVAILFLVLAKPDLRLAFPSWLTEPIGGQLPFTVPSR
jgi:uncharacterized membrane protein